MKARRTSNLPVSGKAPEHPEDYVAYLYQDLDAGPVAENGSCRNAETDLGLSYSRMNETL